MVKRSLPNTASVAQTGTSGKLVAPSAERNLDALCDLMEDIAPQSGTALELASGTGQHVVGFAERLPGLTWQPSEVDAIRRASIDAYVADADLNNIATAVPLDATVSGWGTSWQVDLVVLINLLHLISTPESLTLIAEASRAMRPGGRFVIYGPFTRAGRLTSSGDERFHTSLAEHDPEIGYKDDFDVMDMLQGAGLTMIEVIEMPANNLALVAEKTPI
jgi:SAM-dependent methyltransferase